MHSDLTERYTFMSRNKQLREYLIGYSYKNDEFDWPFDLVTVTESKYIQQRIILAKKA